ncbi:glycerophosphodiester phosphodiesterase family protein [Microbacterium betulae]|uniref:Glycerophosphodiester phosphodiesterase family protein n=1 Tax=Microbacterium betulae TaxID=2981139 RepID=A0AA97FG28_9MICO|nr:glycerophosphodiester phosphodiesterase family protein [Microbacterium sp. AB]WOF22538.1 glycerophosphodiester phosphodiesterase family protein [Microbacterium sp. AB]
MTLGTVVSAAIVASGALVVTNAAADAAASPREVAGQPLVIAHRGNSSLAPENTLPALDSAARSGADLLEIDVDYTRDGEIVVLHDDSVDRTTDGTGNVRELTSSDVRALDAGGWFSPLYAGTPIPTLDDVLDFVTASDATLLLEFKSSWSERRIGEALALIESHGAEDRVIAQSFDTTTLASLRDAAPGLARMVLVDEIDDPVASAEEFDAIGVNPRGEDVLGRREIVDEIHDAGLLTYVWTVDDAQDWAGLADAGVDGIVTNRPDRLAGWLASDGTR